MEFLIRAIIDLSQFVYICGLKSSILKRRIVAILLLFSLVAPIAATFTILHFQRIRIRRMVKQQILSGIDRENLVLLKFSEEESQTKLSWKHSKEFAYNNRMYDVVETETRGDTTFYWCHEDKKETRLDRKLDELLASALGKSPQKKKNQQRLTHFFSSLYFEQLPRWKPVNVANNLVTTPYTNNFHNIFYPPPVPPPETA